MELLKLSKFKLQLQALITEVKYLRERERSSTEQLHLLIQKQKQTEEECGRKLQKLQDMLASSDDLCQKLEKKVNYLQNDNVMLESKHRELKGTVQNLLQSRESFVNVYEESTCEMRRAIETRDRQLAILYERINSHLSLFDSIEKEAFSIKQVVDNVQYLVTQKEEVVVELKSRMEEMSAFEKIFVDKICFLENKLKSNEDEIRRKDKIIAELELQLEAAKVHNACHSQVEELQNALSAKDMVIKSLVSDKEALNFQVRSLGATFQKIQETVESMNGEDKRVFSLTLEHQEPCAIVEDNHNRAEDAVSNVREKPSNRTSGIVAAENIDSPRSQKYLFVGNPLQDNQSLGSRASELSSSPLPPACSEDQSTTNGPSICDPDVEDKSSVLVQHLDFECSTAPAETSGNPGTQA